MGFFTKENNNIELLSAKDAMIKPVFVYANDDSEKIIKKLKQEDTNVCIVINEDGKFIGEISDNDLIKLFLKQVKFEPLVKQLNIGYKREFLYKTAKQMINKHKSTVKEDTPINQIINLIYKEDCSYIPVLDKNNKVKGVITPSSLIKLLENY